MTRMLVRFGALGLLISAPAWAQYTFNPANADEQQPGVRWFGAVRSVDGERVVGATVRLQRERAAFLVVSGDDGRYRVDLPVEMTIDRVAITCFREGYEFVRLEKRAGPAGAKRTSVQADCVLRARGAR